MKVCLDCGGEMSAREYTYGDPNRYDGVSEWVCSVCGVRFGRWSGRRLEGDDVEPPWGGNDDIHTAPSVLDEDAWGSAQKIKERPRPPLKVAPLPIASSSDCGDDGAGGNRTHVRPGRSA